jgi:hypothetical protein
VEQAVMKALEMHPDGRSSSIVEFRAELLSTTAPSSGPLTASDTFIKGSIRDIREMEWVIALRDNGILLAIVLGLLLIAVLVTLRAPTVQPPLPPTRSGEPLGLLSPYLSLYTLFG